MTQELKIKCPAKINLTLDVIRRRPDGYHDLEMIMHQVNLHDTLTVSVETNVQKTEIILTSDSSDMPTDDSNLICKAAKLFFEQTGITASARVYVCKNIPMGAGLGGGSTDCAGMLTALNTVFDQVLPMDKLAAMAKSLGADVPFFLYGGCMLAQGIGEKLSPLPLLKDAYILLAKPPVHVSTAFVYKNLVLDKNTKHPNTKSAIEALKNGDIELLAKSCGNVLETVTAKEYPEIEEYKARMRSHGAAYSLMSGSGSSVFGIYKKESDALSALKEFKTITECAYLV